MKVSYHLTKSRYWTDQTKKIQIDEDIASAERELKTILRFEDLVAVNRRKALVDNAQIELDLAEELTKNRAPAS